MPFHPQLNPQFPLDPLYCEEEECHWDDNERDSSNADNYHNAPPLDLDSSWEDEELASLLHKEQENQQEGTAAPHHQDPATAKARGDAVEWMLKVVHYYSFSVLTAVLAVNYLDRFLQSFKSHGENKEKKKPWMTQLAAVACISLAAKVEETHVPLLLDLQVEESDYVFESKTIQRMEILVLSTLQWRMNPVTPISFLDCIASKLGFFGQISREFLRRCHCLLLSLLSDCRMMNYLPSALATATMVYVISSVEPTVGVEHHRQLIGILGINSKDKVENCCRLIEEVATTSEFFFSCNKRKVGWIPASPKGVDDVCFSSGDSSAAASPEPLSKKFKSK